MILADALNAAFPAQACRKGAQLTPPLAGWLLLAALLLFAPLCTKAQSTLRICNHGDTNLSVMTLVNYNNPLQVMFNLDGWTEDGWTIVNMNECQTVYEPPNNQPAYLGFAYLTNDGEMRSPVIAAGHDTNWIRDADRFVLCVSADHFNVRDRDFKNLQQCSGNRSIQIPLSVYFEPAGNSDYTFSASPHQGSSLDLRPKTPIVASSSPARPYHRITKPIEPPMSAVSNSTTDSISQYGSGVILSYLKLKPLLAAADSGFTDSRFHTQVAGQSDGANFYRTGYLFPRSSEPEECLSITPRSEPTRLACIAVLHTSEEANAVYTNLYTALLDRTLQLREGIAAPEVRESLTKDHTYFYAAYTSQSAYVELYLDKIEDNVYWVTLSFEAPEGNTRSQPKPIPRHRGK